ncbi:hypothetical protein AB0C59_19170 [Streptomyces sp. NPDC048664]|uniref:hypothetical protein n=1 Tax=Streptomyces sp. NPDC048664 TaxID=3154505 RepID=UPI003441CA65
MPGRLNRSLLRGVAASGVCAGLLLSSSAAATASNGVPTDPGSSSTTPTSSDGRITSQVSVTSHGAGGDARPVTSSDVNWTAPPCWYEPAFTPDQFKDYLQNQYETAGKANASTVYNYYNQVQSDMNKIHYHKGDDGKWWMLVDNKYLPPAQVGTCELSPSWAWVDPANPAPAQGVTPEMLSQIAYGATKLPSRTVTLSPAADKQKVNVPTRVAFTDAIEPVWVTAQLASANIAATVVARPDSLRVDAQTQYADPQSCTYKFTTSGGGYQVDSSHSDCNVTYRKSSGSGTYKLTARITWKVTWNPTAGPNGPNAKPLPDGFSDSDQDVTVKEIQSVVQ